MQKAKQVFEKIRVLIVDDNPVDRHILRAQLEELGFLFIQEAQSGSEGIFKVENGMNIAKPFHLVISDWRMPDKDGMTLLKFLKNSGALKEAWMIMLTGVNDKESIKQAILKGVDDFMIKPVDVDLLRTKILKLTQQKAA